MRLIDADEVRKYALEAYHANGVELEPIMLVPLDAIDNAQTIIWCSETSEGYPLMDLRPKGECKTCRHRDPEDKKCDCGELERAGCTFPVSDKYYCKYYEKGDA